MKRTIFIITMLLGFCIMHTEAQDLSKISEKDFSKLSERAYIKGGHFIGKTERGISNIKDPLNWMRSCEIVFDFWGLLGEPCYDFRFKWEKSLYGELINGKLLNTVSATPLEVYISNYPELIKLVEKMRPLAMPEPVVRLQIALYSEQHSFLALVMHDAKIDLPRPAGEWSVFAFPGSDDWIKTFPPTTESTSGITYAKRQSELSLVYKTGDKDAYKKLMIDIFRNTNHIEVQIMSVSNIQWPTWDIEHIKSEIKRDLIAKKAAHQQQLGQQSDDDFWSTTSRVQSKQDDDFWTSTGYSAAEQATRATDRANAAFDQVASTNDKTRLNEARNLYNQALQLNPNSEHIHIQLAVVDKMLNWKAPKDISQKEMEVFKDESSKKYGVKSYGEIVIKPEYDKILLSCDDQGQKQISSNPMYIGCQKGNAIVIFNREYKQVFQQTFSKDIKGFHEACCGFELSTESSVIESGEFVWININTAEVTENWSVEEYDNYRISTETMSIQTYKTAVLKGSVHSLWSPIQIEAKRLKTIYKNLYEKGYEVNQKFVIDKYTYEVFYRSYYCNEIRTNNKILSRDNYPPSL